jgi:hypothetical protein
MYDFAFLAPCPASGLMVHGTKDQVVPEADAQKLVDRLSAQRGIKITYDKIEGANHFFDKHEAEVVDRLYRLRLHGDSLHVGSLVQIMMLRRLQQAGHRPIVLMGGGTTKVGDPSGKDEARQLLTDEQIAANMAGIRRCFSRS